jgi:hypothetical protein
MIALQQMLHYATFVFKKLDTLPGQVFSAAHQLMTPGKKIEIICHGTM